MQLLSEIFLKRKERKSLAKRRETETDKGDVKPFMASSLGFGYDPSFRSSYHDSKKKDTLFIQTRRRIQGERRESDQMVKARLLRPASRSLKRRQVMRTPAPKKERKKKQKEEKTLVSTDNHG